MESIIRERILSRIPPIKPESSPSVIPTDEAKRAAAKAMPNIILEPCIIRERTSLDKISVPNG
jgi:hypothetical protein